MSYTIVVRFSRELQDDLPIVEDNPAFHNFSYRDALRKQFHLELQEAYDKSEGGLAGLFNIVSVKADDKKTDKTLNDLVLPQDPVRAALVRIAWARDWHAEHGVYPKGTLGEDQSFDDWAADVAERALKATQKKKGK